MQRGGCLVAAALCLTLAGAAAAHGRDMLPDLNQLVPRGLVVKQRAVDGQRRVLLGFSSAAANVGAGPLTLHGHRADRGGKTMSVDQLLDQTQGPSRLIRDVGQMSYVVHPDHRHWHLVDFERYELRSGDGAAVLATDRKTGFCLGDRYALAGAAALAGFNPVPLQGDTCGLGQLQLTNLFVGISVGWADRYAAHLEGQFIDVTGLPDGEYVLVHRLNLEDKIVESDYSNNASSVRLRLRKSSDGSAPRAMILRRCPGTERCAPIAPSSVREGRALTPGAARQSPNGDFRVVMQRDGNLVVERSGEGVIWASGTSGHTGAVTTLQRDGNLVIRADHKPIWATDTAGGTGRHRLAIQDDGNLVLYSGSTPLWSSYNG